MNYFNQGKDFVKGWVLGQLLKERVPLPKAKYGMVRGSGA